METALEKNSEAKKAAAAAAEERMVAADVHDADDDDDGAASIGSNPETDTESIGECPSVVVQPHMAEECGEVGGKVIP